MIVSNMPSAGQFYMHVMFVTVIDYLPYMEIVL